MSGGNHERETARLWNGAVHWRRPCRCTLRMVVSMTCRNCALYDLDGAKSPGGYVQSGRVAKCNWTIASIKLPASVRGYSQLRASYMQPNDGKDCECFIKRTTA